MKIGNCGSVDQAPLAQKLGFDYIEENVQSFLKPLDSNDAFAPNLAKAQSSPLPIPAANAFLPGTLKSTGPDVDLPAIERYAAVAFRRAQQVGIQRIVFGSGASRRVPDGFDKAKALDQFVDVLRRIGPIAADHNVIIVIEPLQLSECNLINTVAQGAEIVRRADHPHVQLLADFFHMLRNGESPEDCREYGSLIRHTHLAEKRERTCPGIDGDDFTAFLQALFAAGYTGLLSLECKFPHDIETDAPNALAVLRKQIAAARGD